MIDFFKVNSDFIAEAKRIKASGGKDTQESLRLGVRNKIANVFDEAMVAAGKGDPSEIEAARKILKSFSSATTQVLDVPLWPLSVVQPGTQRT